ncbi:MAG: metallophosphoesterase [Ignavibacteria bacterium]|nr:metallophosphoesterase [Ignavibacteria bacterium]
MNQQPNFTLFSIIAGAILVVLDVYVLAHWTKFAKRRQLRPMWYNIPWIIAAAFLILNIAIALRRHFFRLDSTDTLLVGLITFWYLPKVPIMLFLIVRDVLKLMLLVGSTVNRIFRLGVKQQTPKPAVLAPSESRRTFLGKATWSLAAVPYVITGSSMLSTVYDFQVMPVELVLPNLPRSMDGLKIIQISDIHAGSFPDYMPFQEALRLVTEQRPDAIVITGDFVNARPEELSIIARDLERLRAPEGVYASLGNHDHYNSPAEHKQIVSMVKDLRVDLLINENRRIGGENSRLVLAGMDNTGMRQDFGRIDLALRGTLPDDAIILMSHDPTFWDRGIVGQTPVGLTLSGHTHGGQFGVQAFGFEWSPAQYVYKQWAGLYRTGDQVIYVNRGLGTVGPPVRVGIPPEITVFTLRSHVA